MHTTILRNRLGLLLALGALGALPPPALQAASNAPPQAVDDSINTAEGTPGDTNVLANDSDPDGDALTIVGWTDATFGSVGCGTTDCTYTPTTSASPEHRVSDGRGGTCTGVEKVAAPLKRGKTAVENSKSFNSFG